MFQLTCHQLLSAENSSERKIELHFLRCPSPGATATGCPEEESSLSSDHVIEGLGKPPPMTKHPLGRSACHQQKGWLQDGHSGCLLCSNGGLISQENSYFPALLTAPASRTFNAQSIALVLFNFALEVRVSILNRLTPTSSFPTKVCILRMYFGGYTNACINKTELLLLR